MNPSFATCWKNTLAGKTTRSLCRSFVELEGRVRGPTRSKPRPASPLRAAHKGEVAVATRRRLCDGKDDKQSCEGRRGSKKESVRWPVSRVLYHLRGDDHSSGM